MAEQKTSTAKSTASSSWGMDAPAWIIRLAEACDRTSQSKVAEKINRSPSLVNMVLKNKYPGRLDAIQARFEAAYKSSIECPVLGEISGTDCLKNQALPFNPGNHVAVRLFRACKSCPFNVKCNGGGNA
ncbi:MAG: hypothetical protein DI551_05285 [Micavibrio aeruginosavorus]|uniref:Transcriptional regulator n=1 Tax=Micavibrio aeruginosavorus TaxID=349221 RepID=A0A2W5N1N2_9BACT|nr:MAG: hypothetical protein DI551_05285 [Micavibrio aeruginosavorus]